MPIQQELRPEVTSAAGDDADELYEDRPRRRRWGTIASVVLALALFFVGYQWSQAQSRAELLSAQLGSVRTEAETQRLRAEDAQHQVDGLQKRLASLAAEKDQLTDRVASLERTARDRVAQIRESPPRPKTVATRPVRPRATPVATKAPTAKTQ
jgi:septal ring factor EnvC (AmiA/AmiB activator)